MNPFPRPELHPDPPPEQGHNHDHDHAHAHDHGEGQAHMHPVTSNLKVAFFLNLTFTLIEIAGGFFTNSMAILSDAVHDLGDTLAIGSSLVLERYAGRKRDQRFSYGYRRFSPLSALVNSVILLAGSIVIIIETIPRLLAPEEVHVPGMIGLAVLGILMNGAAVWRLRSKGDSINQRVVMLHLLEDTLGWGAVLIGSVIMLFVDWPIIDPILSILIALYILWNAGRNLWSVMNIFLQGIPRDMDLEAVKHKLAEVEEVADVHDTHLWSMDGRYNVLTVHLVLRGNPSLSEQEPLKQRIRALLHAEDIAHVTIEFEHPEADCELADC